jgi:hypothetical protein
MALFENIIELRKYNSALSGNIELDNLQSFINEGLNRHIYQAIGYDQVTTLIDQKATASVKQDRVLDLLQHAAVAFMVYYWADQGAVQFSDLGIHVAKDSNKLPASDKKIIALKKQNIGSGYAALETAVSFLEDNINDFPIYKESAEHARNRALLINTATEFQGSGVNINQDARLYATLRSYQETIEATYIEPVLGYDIKEALHLAILNNSLSAEQQQLLKRVRKAVAAYTMAEAIPFMVLSMDASGIFQLSETVGGISGNVENRSSASDLRLSVAMNRYHMSAEQHLETVRKYLAAHKADFGYTTPEPININDNYQNVFFI